MLLSSAAIASLFYIICLLTSTGAGKSIVWHVNLKVVHAGSSPYFLFSVSEGTVRLVQNGVATTSQAYSAGIVQIYYLDAWGNICDDFDFGSAEADVLCHQLSYSGASTFSNTGITSM